MKRKVKSSIDDLDIKDIQMFLELANYYWQFIQDFIFITRLLYDLVKKNKK